MRFLLVSCLPLLAAAMTCPPSPVPGLRACWDRIRELDAVRNPDGHLPPGGEDPDCDASGRFKPKQCSGSQCYCVDPRGDQLPSSHGGGKVYTKNRWEADDMACNCAVKEAEVAKGGAFGVTIDCDEKGDYHHTQCQGTLCYCVHPSTGVKKIGTESNIADFSRVEDRCANP